MGSTSDKIKGKGEQAAGKLKQGVGEVTGDHDLKREGKADEARGEVREGVGKVKDAVKRGVDRL